LTEFVLKIVSIVPLKEIFRRFFLNYDTINVYYIRGKMK